MIGYKVKIEVYKAEFNFGYVNSVTGSDTKNNGAAGLVTMTLKDLTHKIRFPPRGK